MSIWFTNTFVGAVLRKNGRWMGTLSEEGGGDGGFSAVWKRRNFICSEVHTILSDLPLYRSGAKLGPATARKFVNSMSNAPGSAACRLECYDQVLLIFYAKVYFEKKLAFLGYILRGRFCQLFNSESGVLEILFVEVRA
jgi:hypothetical protein